MHTSPSFVVLIALANTLTAFGAVSLPVYKISGRAGGGADMKGVPHADRARARHLKSHGTNQTSGQPTVPATQFQYIQYTTSMGFGNPPTFYNNIVVDTGSSNTFVGTGKPYVKTSTSIPTGHNVSVTYGGGFCNGTEYIDQVTIGSLVIKNQAFGDAYAWGEFNDLDGIVGLGPIDLTLNTVSSEPNATIPTVMINAVEQGLIAENILGVSFAPTSLNDSTNGALTFGGVDSKYYIGDISYVDLTKTTPSSYYWGINVTEVKYGDTVVAPQSMAGIVDTGTTLVLLADNYLDIYISAIPGAKQDELGLVAIPNSSISSMKSLEFTIGDKVFSLDPAAQLVPPSAVPYYGDTPAPGTVYSIVGPMGSPSGEGFDFLLGQTFTERYYTVFDWDHQRVGFAETAYTFTN